MSNKLLIPVALILGLAVGLGVGLVLGDGTAQPEQSPAAARDHVAAAEPTAREGREARRPAAPSRSVVPRRSADDTADDLVIRGVRVDTPEPGDGTITGAVRTTAGEPVAGVLVRASAHEPHSAADPHAVPGAMPRDDLDTLVRAFAEKTAARLARRRETRSGADGTYTLGGLGGGAYRVEAHGDGQEIESAVPAAGSWARSGDTIDFVAHELVEVVVQARRSAGEAPERVSISQSVPPRTQRWTPAQPTIRLRAGTHELSAVAGTYEEARSEPQRVEVSVGMAPVEITLIDRPTITGRVLPAEGDTSREAGTVRLLRFVSGAAPSATRVQDEGKSDYIAIGDGFRYTFRDLEPGLYAVGAHRYGAPLPSVEIVEVGDGLLEHDLTFPLARRADYVVLRVVGPDGSPVTDVEIGTGFATASMSSRNSGGTPEPKPDGTFHIFHHDVSGEYRGLEDAKYFILVESKRYGSREVEYQLGSAVDLTVQFQEPASLTVQVQGLRPELVEITQVSIAPKEPAQDDLEAEVSLHGMGRHASGIEANGEARFTMVEPGQYTVAVAVGGHRVAEQLTVVSGTSVTSRVPMPSLHTLSIVAPDQTGATLWVEREASEGAIGWYDHRSVPSDGVVVVKYLPPGEYTVRLDPDGDGEQQTKIATVPGVSEVRFP